RGDDAHAVARGARVHGPRGTDGAIEPRRGGEHDADERADDEVHARDASAFHRRDGTLRLVRANRWIVVLLSCLASACLGEPEADPPTTHDAALSGGAHDDSVADSASGSDTHHEF